MNATTTETTTTNAATAAATTTETTTTNAAATTTETVVNTLNVRREQSARPTYQRMIKAILTAQEGLDNLLAYYQDQAIKQQEVAKDSMEKLHTNRRGRKNNDQWLARIRKVAAEYSRILAYLEKVYRQEEYTTDQIIKLSSSGVCERGVYEPLTMVDKLKLLQGERITGSDNRWKYGIYNFAYQNYAFIRSEKEGGHVLLLNGQEYPITGEAIYALIMSAKDSLYQDVPYNNAGVMATTSNNPSYNGITFLVDPGTITLATGEALAHERIRVSLELMAYRVFGLAMAYGQNPERYEGYKILNDMVVGIFGDRKHFAENWYEVQHIQGVTQVMSKKSTEGGYEPTSSTHQDETFQPGRYMGMRGIADMSTMFDHAKFKAGQIAMDDAWQKSQEARRATSDAPDTSDAPATSDAPKPKGKLATDAPSARTLQQMAYADLEDENPLK